MYVCHLQGDSPQLDLIALGETIDSPDADQEIIFDPLLMENDVNKQLSSVHRPLQRSYNPFATPPVTQQQLLGIPQAPVQKPSTSSEDLLREYGLDFSKLSMPKPPVVLPVVNNCVNNNLLDDLDPLLSRPYSNAPTTVTPRPTSMPPPPPVAPPRNKRPSQNWTTFE